MSLPAALFETPLLRGLDGQARRLLSDAGRVRRVPPGTVLYSEHEDADTILVILAGTVELWTVPRSGEQATVVRRAEQGDTIGQESCLGLQRRTSAIAAASPFHHEVEVAELPANLFMRGLGRSGASAVTDRERRILIREATADLLRSFALGDVLPETDRELVLDSVVHQSLQRHEVVFEQGDPADDAVWVVEGLVQLQTHHHPPSGLWHHPPSGLWHHPPSGLWNHPPSGLWDEDRIDVCAYLSRGDLFGDAEAIAGTPRQTSAVAMGATRVLRIPGSVMRTLADRNPALLEGIRRIAADKQAVQQDVVGEAAALTTRHVFHDLYRMQMARSLLVIDQDACVRCGHCAWTCAATHEGVSRLVRRGDKIVTRLPVLEGSSAQTKSLLVPNSCQHCRNPACMVDCPTGAIGRDPRGEVFIRPELCTGCGACAKACPWDNISMAPRGHGSVARPRQSGPGTSVPKPSDLVAVKCDLCRAYEGPACVQACPTEAIVRLDPHRDVAEVAAVLGAASTGSSTPSRPRLQLAAAVPSVASAACLGLAIASARLHADGIWQPGQGIAAWTGWGSLVVLLALTGYALPKRRPGLWLRRRAKGARAEVRRGAPVRSRMRRWFRLHTVLGWLGVAMVAGHAGLRWLDGAASVSTALGWCVAAVASLGIWGAIVYRVVPPRLARIERDGALPEDLRHRRSELLDRLYRDVSGRSEVVKELTRRVLLPYATRSGGFIALGLSGRSQADERRRLRRAIDVLLQGRAPHKLAGIDDLIATAVELRALPLRRALTAALRGWLAPHIVATAVLWVLVAAHLVVVGGSP